MVLQAAFDDSETKSKSGHFVMAGFVSTAERWAIFSEEWADVLAKHPRIASFSWSEASRLKGEFSAFTPAKRDQRVLELVRVIRRNTEFRVHTGIAHRLHEGFKALPAIKRTQATDTPTPLMLMMLCKMVALAAGSLRLSGPCNIHFDQQSYEKTISDDWPSMLSSIRRDCKRLGVPCVVETPPTYRSPARFRPLEAADLFAGALRECLDSGGKLPHPLSLLFDIPGLDYAFKSDIVANHLAILTAKAAQIQARNPLQTLRPIDPDPRRAKRERKYGRTRGKTKPSSGGQSS